MAYALAGSMDRGAKEYQIEAAIGKVYASVCILYMSQNYHINRIVFILNYTLLA